MPDLSEALRQAHQSFQAPPDPYERWLGRRERQARNRRVGGTVLGGALAVAVAVSLAVVAIRSGPAPAVIDRGPARNGLIAYADGAQLFTVHPNGGGRTVVPTPPGQAWRVSWSRDGTELAVTIFPLGGGARSVWVMKADGSVPVRVAAGRNVSRASWSPDGTELAIAVAASGGGSAIHVVSADGSDDRIVSPVETGGRVNYFDAVWSPDGTRIAFSKGTDAGFDVYVMDADGSNIVQLSDDGHSYDPSWSPDGRQIAFTRQGTGAQSDVDVMDADGSHVRRLTNDGPGTTNLDPQWSPDGTRIAYVAGKNGGPGPIVSMNPNGSDPVTLVRHGVVGFSWQPVFTGVSPAGSIAYMRLTKPLTEKDSSDLFSLDAASGEVAPVHEGTGFSVWPQWSPDGSLIAYASNETAEGDIGIFVADAVGRHPVDILAPAGMLQDGGPISLSWSPDGSRIAYAGRRSHDGESGVRVVNADGTEDHEVLSGHWESVSWSPRGDLLLVGGDPLTGPGAGRFDVYTVRLDGSGLARLTDDEAIERQPLWSPDASQIVFAEVTAPAENHDYGQDVFVMDADGSDVRRLTDWEGFDSFAVWSPDGDWIAFASDRDASPEQRRGNSEDRPLSGVSIYVMRPDGSGVHRLAEGGDVALLPSSWTY